MSTQMRPVPIQQTLLLLNNFITNTAVFLQDFSDSCEKKISKVSAKINEIEITMSVLEAKLNSIPGLDFGAGDLPPASAPPPHQAAPSVADMPLPDVVPAPTSAQSDTPIAPAAVEPAADSLPDGMVRAKDHLDYAKFFKLVKLGVPGPVIAAKMRAEDLDDTCLDNPDKLVPAASQIEDLD